MERTAVLAYRIPDTGDLSFPSTPEPAVKAVSQQDSYPTGPPVNYTNVWKLLKRVASGFNDDTNKNTWVSPSLFDGIGFKVKDDSRPGEDDDENGRDFDSSETELEQVDDSNTTSAVDTSYDSLDADLAENSSENDGAFDSSTEIEEVEGPNTTTTLDTSYLRLAADPNFANTAVRLLENLDLNRDTNFKSEDNFPEFSSAESIPISITKNKFLTKMFILKKLLMKRKQHRFEGLTVETNVFDPKTIQFLINPDSLSDFLKHNPSSQNALHLLVYYDDTGVKNVTKVKDFGNLEEPINDSNLKTIQITLKLDGLAIHPSSTSKFANTKSKRVKCYFKPNRENEIEKGPDCVDSSDVIKKKIDSETRTSAKLNRTVSNTTLDDGTNVDGRGTNSSSVSHQPDKPTNWILKVIVYITGEFLRPLYLVNLS